MTSREREITNRFLKFVDHTKMSDKTFGEEIGASSQTMTKLRTFKEPLRGVTFMKTMLKFPQLNGNWLIHGTGNMTEKLNEGHQLKFCEERLKLERDRNKFLQEKLTYLEKQK